MVQLLDWVSSGYYRVAMMNEQITATEFLKFLEHDEKLLMLDVRSEDEYAKGSIPQSINIPILNNSHRKTVGITYKMMSQDAAIRIGHELVSPIQETIINSWRSSLQPFSEERRFLFCWRGGLRSQMATQWLLESGFRTRRVAGGYKALRHELHHALTTNFDLILLTGPQALENKITQRFSKTEQLDLEPSRSTEECLWTSGWTWTTSQQTFENLLGLRLYTPSPLYG